MPSRLLTSLTLNASPSQTRDGNTGAFYPHYDDVTNPFTHVTMTSLTLLPTQLLTSLTLNASPSQTRDGNTGAGGRTAPPPHRTTSQSKHTRTTPDPASHLWQRVQKVSG